MLRSAPRNDSRRGQTRSAVATARASRHRAVPAGAPGTTTSTTSPRPICATTWRAPPTGRSTSYSSTTAPARDRRLAAHQSALPLGVDGVAAAIAAAGRVPGLWLAPFLAAPDAVAREHPEWLERYRCRQSAGRHVQPAVGRRSRRLDVGAGYDQSRCTRPPRGCRRRRWPAWGSGTSSSTSRTPRRWRAFADLTRDTGRAGGAGLDASGAVSVTTSFSWAAAVPLARAVGVVDGMRIGPDVAPRWAIPARRARCYPAMPRLRAGDTPTPARNTLVRASCTGVSG